MTEQIPVRKKVKVDQHLGRYRHPIVSNKYQGGLYSYQPFPTKVKDSKLQPNYILSTAY